MSSQVARVSAAGIPNVQGRTGEAPAEQTPSWVERVAYPPTSKSSFLIAFAATLLVTAYFTFNSPESRHWFVLPLMLCGVLTGADAVEWIRSRLHVFDPVGVLGLVGYHFFFLVPLLHVYWDYWGEFYSPPDTPRDWLGGMALLNAAGLMLYRFVRGRKAAFQRKKAYRTVWRLDKNRFFIVVTVALVVTALLQALTYTIMGGIAGYVEAYTERSAGGESFEGVGWLFSISESFPILALMAFAVWASKGQTKKSIVTVILLLVAFLALRMLFGGLRGSRSNTIWSLFWALGIIHLWLRPVSRKLILAGVAVLVVFMYLYGLYKGAGTEATEVITDTEAQVALAESSNRTYENVIVGDLGRSEMQALILYRLVAGGVEYDLAWGRTYVGAITQLIPRSIWPDRPPTKLKEGTEIQYGTGFSPPGIQLYSTRQYGLGGEAMLNFGPVGAVLSFVVLGLLVRRQRHLLANWRLPDPRLLILPFLIMFCFVVLVVDSDNLLFVLVKNGAIPFLVILLSSSWGKVAEGDEPGTRAAPGQETHQDLPGEAAGLP